MSLSVANSTAGERSADRPIGLRTQTTHTLRRTGTAARRRNIPGARSSSPTSSEDVPVSSSSHSYRSTNPNCHWRQENAVLHARVPERERRDLESPGQRGPHSAILRSMFGTCSIYRCDKCQAFAVNQGTSKENSTLKLMITHIEAQSTRVSPCDMAQCFECT